MIISIAGNNRHARLNKLQELIQKQISEQGDLSVERFDASEHEIEQINSSIINPPLLTESKLVVINQAEAAKIILENIEDLIDKIPDSVQVVLNFDKLDKRAAYTKALKKQTDFHEFTEAKSADLPGWVIEESKKQGYTIGNQAARFLVEYVGTNQARLINEISKLGLYQTEITKETIQLLCQPLPQSTVFELLDAAFAGNNKKALAIYQQQRLQKVEPLAILAMIAWQLHIMALVKTAGSGDTAEKAGVHRFVWQKTSGLVKRLSLEKLRQLINEVVSLEVRLKSQTIEADDALRQLLLSLEPSN